MGMSQSKCWERSLEVEGDSPGSCAFVSFAPTYNNGQTGCWCFVAEECQSVKAKPTAGDGEWTTFTISEVFGLGDIAVDPINLESNDTNTTTTEPPTTQTPVSSTTASAHRRRPPPSTTAVVAQPTPAPTQ